MLKPVTAAVIFLGGLALTGAVACQKAISNKVPAPITDSVSAMVNDSAISFNAEVTVDTSSIPGVIYIVAHSDLANFTPLLEITIPVATPIKDTIYSDPLNSGNPGLLGYTAWNGVTDNQFYSVSDTVSVSSVSKSSIAGTFQGTCQYTYFPNDSTPTVVETLTITNGRFNVGLGQ